MPPLMTRYTRSIIVPESVSRILPRPFILVYCDMQPTEEQLEALGNYSDIILQHIPEIAETIGVSVKTLKGWSEGEGEPTAEQAAEILDFLKKKGASS